MLFERKIRVFLSSFYLKKGYVDDEWINIQCNDGNDVFYMFFYAYNAKGYGLCIFVFVFFGVLLV